MAYKTICAIITDTASGGDVLQAAHAVARRQEAHLDIYCLGIDPTRYDMLPVNGSALMLERAAEMAREAATELTDWVKANLPPDLPATPTQINVQPAIALQSGVDAAVARLARYSDLIVIAQPYGEDRENTHVAAVEAAIFATGAPVLVVPRAARDWSVPFRRIMIGWDESDVSLEAVRDSLPFLAAAEQVDVVLVDPPRQSPERADPGGAITLMLARHGIRAEVAILARNLPSVAGVLARYASEQGVDAIVMGAYGHSRLREAILGGPTRDMLEHARLPLLMSH